MFQPVDNGRRENSSQHDYKNENDNNSYWSLHTDAPIWQFGDSLFRAIAASRQSSTWAAAFGQERPFKHRLDLTEHANDFSQTVLCLAVGRTAEILSILS